MSMFNNAYVQGVNPRTLDLFAETSRYCDECGQSACLCIEADEGNQWAQRVRYEWTKRAAATARDGRPS